MNKKNKSTKRNARTRKSLKGKWNHIGAPPKSTKWPARPFTMEKLFAVNSKGPNAQCQLSLRNKVDERVAAGELIELKSKKQAHGGVGRPKAVFVLATNFDAAKMEKADKKAKTPKAKKPTVAVVTPTPATAPAPVVAAPVASSAAPAPVETVAAPAPAVTAPVVSESAPAAPAPAVESAPAPAPQVG